MFSVESYVVSTSIARGGVGIVLGCVRWPEHIQGVDPRQSLNVNFPGVHFTVHRCFITSTQHRLLIRSCSSAGNIYCLRRLQQARHLLSKHRSWDTAASTKCDLLYARCCLDLNEWAKLIYHLMKKLIFLCYYSMDPFPALQIMMSLGLKVGIKGEGVCHIFQWMCFNIPWIYLGSIYYSHYNRQHESWALKAKVHPPILL